MRNTEKWVARMTAELLVAHGVKHVVVSPGSRNAPLVVAVARNPRLEHHVIIDERSAAFFALGMASCKGEPVALICTSGTALLNYAPALAEAMYRQLPLIAVTADRPAEWIDQADSQTIRQPGTLANVVKRWVNVTDAEDPDSRWHSNRLVNEAIIAATTGRKGPVHINVQLHTPLGNETDVTDAPAERVIRLTKASELNANDAHRLADEMTEAGQIMIVAGCSLPSEKLKEAIARLQQGRNIVVLAEPVANLATAEAITRVEETVRQQASRLPSPRLVISLGGPLISKSLKQYLRNIDGCRHWSVGYGETPVDTFMKLDRIIDCDEAGFFVQMDSMLPKSANLSFKESWHSASISLTEPCNGVWDERNAVKRVIAATPRGYNLQLSNGMTVRYAMDCDCSGMSRVDGNRGTSGIEGSTSAAIGLSAADKEHSTLLITGDMSAAYDIGALACQHVTPRFKMVVINNRGGGIFRTVESTRNLDERDECFVAAPLLPLKELAAAYGYTYYKAGNPDNLDGILPSFFAEATGPAILEITF